MCYPGVHAASGAPRYRANAFPKFMTKPFAGRQNRRARHVRSPVCGRAGLDCIRRHL